MLTISLSASNPQSGKDTFAALLKKSYEENGLSVRIIAFGDALRQHVANMFKNEDYLLNLQHLNRPVKDKPMSTYSVCNIQVGYWEYASFLLNKGVDEFKDLSLRFHMQHYGTDFVREFKGLDTLWLDVVTKQLKRWEYENIDIAIVTDTRFPVEFSTLKDVFDAKFFKIEPVGFPESQYQREGRTPHKAESYSDSFDYDVTLFNQYGFPDDMLKQLYNAPSKELNS